MRRRSVLVGLAATGATVLLGGCAKTPLPTVADLLGRWESGDGASITFLDATRGTADRIPRYAYERRQKLLVDQARDVVGGPFTWEFGDVLHERRDSDGHPVVGILDHPPSSGMFGGLDMAYRVDRRGPVLFWVLGDPDDDKFYSLRRVRSA